MLRVYIGTTTWENYLAVPIKVEYTHTFWLSSFTLGMYPREVRICTYKNVYSSIFVKGKNCKQLSCLTTEWI